MFGDMADPGPLMQPLHETTASATAAAVVHQAGQPLYETVGEAGNLVGREILQYAEVDDKLDGWFVVPDVGTT